MRYDPATPSLLELLKSGFGSRERYASSRDFLKFVEESPLEERIVPVLMDENSWKLTLVLGPDSTGSPVDRAVERSEGDAPDPDSEADTDSSGRRSRARV